MPSKSEPTRVERADVFARKRTILLWLELGVFVAWQALFILRPATDASQRLLTLIWAGALLLLMATGGGLLLPGGLRRLMNDEVSTANRREAQVWGFWMAVLAAAGLYGLDVFRPVSPPIALHVVLSAGIGLALARFAWLETRADRAG